MWKLKNIHWGFSVNGKCLFCISNPENEKAQGQVMPHMWPLQINQHTSNLTFNIKFLQQAIYSLESISGAWQVTTNNETKIKKWYPLFKKKSNKKESS